MLASETKEKAQGVDQKLSSSSAVVVGLKKGKIMRVEGSLLPLLVTPLVRALLVLLAVPLGVVEALLVETVPEPHYGEKFYQYGYQVEDLYTGESLPC